LQQVSGFLNVVLSAPRLSGVRTHVSRLHR
jgi:hypothetical protein